MGGRKKNPKKQRGGFIDGIASAVALRLTGFFAPKLIDKIFGGVHKKRTKRRKQEKTFTMKRKIRKTRKKPKKTKNRTKKYQAVGLKDMILCMLIAIL